MSKKDGRRGEEEECVTMRQSLIDLVARYESLSLPIEEIRRMNAESGIDLDRILARILKNRASDADNADRRDAE